MKTLVSLLARSFLDVAPLVGVILFFQLAVIGKPFANPVELSFGFLLVVLGLFVFMRGLDMGLFPLGESMAYSFAVKGNVWLLLAFAGIVGYSTTIAEPALIAIAAKAGAISDGRLDPFTLRSVVAFGVAAGIMVGVLRILLGHPIHRYFIVGYGLVMLMTTLSPTAIIGIAYDSGGVTTSTVTVPLVTALGVGLARSIGGRNPLMDGFGLIAFASLTPMLTVMAYGLMVM